MTELNNSENLESIQLIPLKKHTYPFIAIIFWFCTTVIFFNLMPEFVKNILPKHIKLYKELKVADKYFCEKNYTEAFKVYENILFKHPELKNIRIKIAQCGFNLMQQDINYAIYAIDYLKYERYDDFEFSQICNSLPEEHKIHVMNYLKVLKK